MIETIHNLKNFFFLLKDKDDNLDYDDIECEMEKNILKNNLFFIFSFSSVSICAPSCWLFLNNNDNKSNINNDNNLNTAILNRNIFRQEPEYR